MKNNWIVLFLILIFASRGEGEVVVSLPTHEFVSCVYVAPISSATSSLSAPYLEKLRTILVDDINNSGSCNIEKDVTQSDFIININAVQKELGISVRSKKRGVIYSSPRVKLSGVYYSDRCVMHKIHDALIKIMTGKAGIASNHILYAVQVPVKRKEGVVWKSEIWESDYDGYNPRQITYENSYCITPIFFPVQGDFTSNKFLYVNYKLGQPKIYLGAFDQVMGKPCINLRGNQLLPAISQRGDMIAFISDASGRADLFVQPFSPHRGPIGKPIQTFSFPRSVQASPTFSPDGKKIAFVSDKEGSPRIFVIDTPSIGKDFRPVAVCLTNTFRQTSCPSWSPDGTKLAYSAMIDGSRQIMVYDFLLQEEVQLTQGNVHKENPTWASNSLHIIYNTVGPSSSELFLMDTLMKARGKKPLQITSGSGKKHYPSWKQGQM